MEGRTMDDEMEPFVVTYRCVAGDKQTSTIWAKSSKDAQERFEESDESDGTEILKIELDE
jgi:hypothetical protein